MSMAQCSLCEFWVDTDDDPECYQPDPRMSLRHAHPDVCICETCREKQLEEEENCP